MMLNRKSLWENFCTQAFSFIGCIRDRLHRLYYVPNLYLFDKDAEKKIGVRKNGTFNCMETVSI